MLISLLSSVASNGVIGAKGDLVWREPQDLRHFRETTAGHPVVMGRKTWEALPAPVRPLPGRRNVVITRQADYPAAGAECVPSLEAALALLQGSPKVFVIGGGEIFAAAMPLAGELVLTEIARAFEGDARFPAFDRRDFEVTSRRALVAADGLPFEIVTYRRRAAS